MRALGPKQRLDRCLKQLFFSDASEMNSLLEWQSMIHKRFPSLLTVGLIICFVIFFFLRQAKHSREINLIIASMDGNLDAVIFRSQVISDFNFVSFKGDTPLNAAAKNGHLEIVEYFVDNGARIDLVDVYGRTARMAASKGGHTAIVEYFDEISESN